MLIPDGKKETPLRTIAMVLLIAASLPWGAAVAAAIVYAVGETVEHFTSDQ